MNDIDQRLPRIRVFRLSDGELHTLTPTDVAFVELGETRLTLPQILVLRDKRFEWRCTIADCAHRFTFHVDKTSVAPYWIVRHLLSEHELSGDQIIATQPSLTDEVRDGCEVLGRRTPVLNRTGVPT